MNRCINIDWLEVYCLEPVNEQGVGMLNADYFISQGYPVRQRDFGTPSYCEMFTIAFNSSPREPVFEVRRAPRPNKAGGSFLPTNACHIRMTNKFCYVENPILLMCDFLLRHGYEVKNIKRIDLALDFNRFDSGELPQYVLRDFMTEKLSKINQSKVSCHGTDCWDGRFWNSIRWGSPSSNIATRFYNKSLELQQVDMKTYIQDAWKEAGLDLEHDVWRVEFQIKSGAKGFKNKQSQEFYNMQFSTFSSKSRQLFVFHSLCQKYFHFKYREFTDDGQPKRKDRCRDKKLFTISWQEQTYEPKPLKGGTDPTRMDRILRNKCLDMQDDIHIAPRIKEAAHTLARHIELKMKGYLHG